VNSCSAELSSLEAYGSSALPQNMGNLFFLFLFLPIYSCRKSAICSNEEKNVCAYCLCVADKVSGFKLSRHKTKLQHLRPRPSGKKQTSEASRLSSTENLVLSYFLLFLHQTKQNLIFAVVCHESWNGLPFAATSALKL
jgi:hypothetical protein